MSDGLVRAMIIRQVQTLISVEEVAFCQDRLVEVRNINGREAIKCVGHDGVIRNTFNFGGTSFYEAIVIGVQVIQGHELIARFIH